MNIEQAQVGEVIVFRLLGRVDSTSSKAVETAVLGAIGPATKRIVLDLTEVQYISSAGLRVVLMAAKQVRAVGGGFAVFGSRPSVTEVFEISGFARIVPMVADEPAALALAAGP